MLGDDGAEQTHFLHPLDDLDRVFVGGLQLLGVRRHITGQELVDRIQDQGFLFGVFGIEHVGSSCSGGLTPTLRSFR